MSPKERERLLEQRVDRSHRRGVSSRGQRRGRRPPPWTMGEKAALVLSLAFIFAAAVLTVLLFLS
jgi:type VI protein secretion system component VasF